MASYECRGKSKLWSVRFTTFENGKEITKRLSGYKRKKDAEDAYIQFVNEIKNNIITKTNDNILDRKFIDVYKEYFEYKKTAVKGSTAYDISLVFDKHINPFFCDYKIKEITKPVVLKWQQSLNGYSYKYKTKLRSYLYSLYKYLFYYYDVDNIVDRVEPFKKDIKKQEMSIWSYNEFMRFVDVITDDLVYKTFFIFLFYTGCRLGEALAISYNDVDFINKTITINKSITNKILKEQSQKNFKVTTPKNNGSIRTILICNYLQKILLDYVNTYPDTKNSEFLFGCDKPLDDNTIYRRLIKYANIAEVKKIRIHDFRHSHASYLIHLGANILLVSKRLGHTNTQQTLNTYSHLYPNSEIELINKMNEFGQNLVNKKNNMM